jgi:hypothetical protein
MLRYSVRPILPSSTISIPASPANFRIFIAFSSDRLTIDPSLTQQAGKCASSACSPLRGNVPRTVIVPEEKDDQTFVRTRRADAHVAPSIRSCATELHHANRHTAEGPNHLSTSVRKHFSSEPISLSSDRGATISVTHYALIVVSATQGRYYIKLERSCIAVAVIRVTSVV